MRHFFRVNVAGEGYVFYSGELHRGLRPQPLGVPSAEVPVAFLRTQAKLDEALDQRQLSLAVCVPPVAGQAGPAVAYGGSFQVPDEHRRPGLVLVHGLELDDATWIYPCVATILTRLSAAAVRGLVRELGELAARKAGPTVEGYLRRTAEAVESAVRNLHSSGLRTAAGGRTAISAIEHDCAGAAPVAWLTLAASQTRAAAPWEMFDRIGANGQTETCVHPAQGRKVLASQLLLGAGNLMGNRPASDPDKARSGKDGSPEPPPVPGTTRTSGWATWWKVAAAALLLSIGCTSYLAVTNKTAAEQARARADSDHQKAMEAEEEAGEARNTAHKAGQELVAARIAAGEDRDKADKAERNDAASRAAAEKAEKNAAQANADTQLAKKQAEEARAAAEKAEKNAAQAKAEAEMAKTKAEEANNKYEQAIGRLKVVEELAQQVQAEGLVRSLVADGMPKPDVLKALEKFPSGVREKALAEAYRPDPDQLLKASWKIVCRPGETEEQYERALRQAIEACELAPNQGSYLTTRGLAEYRLAKYRVEHYANAVKTLTKAKAINEKEAYGLALYGLADVAFLAMAHSKLEKKEEARTMLDQLDKLMESIKPPPLLREAWAFQKEATMMIRPPKDKPGP